MKWFINLSIFYDIIIIAYHIKKIDLSKYNSAYDKNGYNLDFQLNLQSIKIIELI